MACVWQVGDRKRDSAEFAFTSCLNFGHEIYIGDCQAGETDGSGGVVRVGLDTRYCFKERCTCGFDSTFGRGLLLNEAECSLYFCENFNILGIEVKRDSRTKSIGKVVNGCALRFTKS